MTHSPGPPIEIIIGSISVVTTPPLELSLEQPLTQPTAQTIPSPSKIAADQSQQMQEKRNGINKAATHPRRSPGAQQTSPSSPICLASIDLIPSQGQGSDTPSPQSSIDPTSLPGVDLNNVGNNEVSSARAPLRCGSLDLEYFDTASQVDLDLDQHFMIGNSTQITDREEDAEVIPSIENDRAESNTFSETGPLDSLPSKPPIRVNRVLFPPRNRNGLVSPANHDKAQNNKRKMSNETIANSKTLECKKLRRSNRIFASCRKASQQPNLSDNPASDVASPACASEHTASLREKSPGRTGGPQPHETTVRTSNGFTDSPPNGYVGSNAPKSREAAPRQTPATSSRSSLSRISATDPRSHEVPEMPPVVQNTQDIGKQLNFFNLFLEERREYEQSISKNKDKLHQLESRIEMEKSWLSTKCAECKTSTDLIHRLACEYEQAKAEVLRKASVKRDLETAKDDPTIGAVIERLLDLSAGYFDDNPSIALGAALEETRVAGKQLEQERTNVEEFIESMGEEKSQVENKINDLEKVLLEQDEQLERVLGKRAARLG